MQAESRSQTLLLELDSLKAELLAAEDALAVAERALEDSNQQESQTQMDVGETQAVYQEAREELDGLEKKMASCSSEVVELKRQKEDLVQEAEGVILEAKKLSVTIARIQKERVGAERVVSSLIKKHAWIESEKSAFGVPGGDYDFEATDPSDLTRHLKELRDEQDVLVS